MKEKPGQISRATSPALAEISAMHTRTTFLSLIKWWWNVALMNKYLAFSSNRPKYDSQKWGIALNCWSLLPGTAHPILPIILFVLLTVTILHPIYFPCSLLTLPSLGSWQYSSTKYSSLKKNNTAAIFSPFLQHKVNPQPCPEAVCKERGISWQRAPG